LQPQKKFRWFSAKTIVVIMIVGAVAFGLLLGYLEYENQSMPSAEKPFGDYANVVSVAFNGTEVDFKVEWTASGNYLPLSAQIASDTDSANSPLCSLGMTSIAKGQTVDLPFTTAEPETALVDVQLFIAVQTNTNKTQFTIEYDHGQINASPGDITPSTYACTQSGENFMMLPTR
jgi:hypothetical protein